MAKAIDWGALGRLMRLDRPIGTLLLLWPTLWGLWMAADGLPPIWILVVFCSGVFLMRSAGCVINDYADRNFDGKVARTKERPLATGAVTSQQALILFVVLALIAFGLVLTLNMMTILMSFAALALAMIYPFTKRFIQTPQLILGAAFAWAIPMAYTAINQTIPNSVWLVYAATVCWVLAYDTLYGMVDKADDVKIGIKSTAILFGKYDLAAVATAQAVFLLLLCLFGILQGYSLFYFAGIAIAAGLVGRQLFWCRNRDTSAYFKAFLNNNSVGAVIFVGLIANFW